MKKTIRMALSGLARPSTANVLNILGLSLAFAAFALILMQVRHELSFDKHYKNADKLYQVQFWSPFRHVYDPFFPRQFADQIGELSPYTDGMAYVGWFKPDGAIYAVEKTALAAVEMPIQLVSDALPQVFGLEIVEGSLRDFQVGDKAIISQKAARSLFGKESPIGKMIDNFNDPLPREVVAVYRDLPANSSLLNGVLGNMGVARKNDLSSWDYLLYLSVPNTSYLSEIETVVGDYVKDHLRHMTFEVSQIARLQTLNDFYFQPANQTHNQGSKSGAYALLGIGLLILAIAVINFVNFSMATVPVRIRNINTRKVLGCGTAQLRWQQIGESIVITLLAAAFSLVLITLLGKTSFAELLKADMSVSQNLFVYLLLLPAAVLIGVTASLYPAWYSTSFSPALVLKGSFGLSVKGRKLRTALIGLQYCISIVLIIVALFIRYQHQFMRFYDIGIDSENIVTVELTPKMAEARKSIESRLQSDPRIADLTYSYGSLMEQRTAWGLVYKGEMAMFDVYPVESNFPEFMGLKVLEGERFSEADKTRAASGCMFNRAAQNKYELEVGDIIKDMVILGVFEDFNFRHLSKDVEPLALYLQTENEGWAQQFVLNQLYLKIATPDIAGVLRDIRAVLLENDPEAANLLKIQFMDETVGELYAQEGKLFSLILLFSLLAVAISTIGVFGLIMFETRYRKKEIAVRKVFGSTVEQILLLLNKHYVRIVLVCYAISIPVAWYVVNEWQRPYAFKAPFSVWIFLASLLIVMLITIATVTVQSYRTAADNPIQALRGN